MSEHHYQTLIPVPPTMEPLSVSEGKAAGRAAADVCRYVDAGFINIADQDEAVAKIADCLRAQVGFRFFTMNLDHVSKLKRYASFRDLYDRATFVSADGWPVALLAGRRTAKISRTTGADLVFPVCRMAAATGVPIYLFGSTEPVLAKAASLLEGLYPGLTIVGQTAPPFHFDPTSDYALRCARAVADSGARLCFVALGAPTQEAFSDASKDICPSTGFLCVGAALDFIAGAQHRAPRIFQRIGMEWAWRWGLSPRRLGRRYFQCAAVFSDIVLARMRKSVFGGPSTPAR